MTRALVLVLSIFWVASAGADPRVSVVTSGLEVPWALAFAPDGRLFVTERPGRIRVVREGRLEPEPIITLPVAHDGEGGLMGLALDPKFAETGRAYVCYTAQRSGRLINRVVALALREPGAREDRTLIDDIPGAGIHDGCRLKFGPDDKLYVTTGDAGDSRQAQRLDAPGGKILRINADGGVPDDNPFRGSPVYSLGHRNVQGIAWDRAGRLWASEHGPSGVPCCHDEINLIRPGGNYGWPRVYGKAGDRRFIDPVVESGNDTWAPSGAAFLGEHLYVGALRGRRLLRITPNADATSAQVSSLLAGTYGRLRDVVAGPDGALYVTTSNRDGRGSPAPDDDRILKVEP